MPHPSSIASQAVHIQYVFVTFLIISRASWKRSTDLGYDFDKLRWNVGVTDRGGSVSKISEARNPGGVFGGAKTSSLPELLLRDWGMGTGL